MKSPRHNNTRGFGIVLAICTVCLCMISLSVLVLHNSYRAQHETTRASLAMEMASKDDALQRNGADDLVSQIVSAVNGGTTTATLSAAVPASYATTLNTTPAQRGDVTDSTALTSKTINVTSVASGFGVSAWSPTVAQYSSVCNN